MASTALNMARCMIAMARNRRPGLIGGGRPMGWTVLTPISSQSVTTLAEAIEVAAQASTVTSASRRHLLIMTSSPRTPLASTGSVAGQALGRTASFLRYTQEDSWRKDRTQDTAKEPQGFIILNGVANPVLLHFKVRFSHSSPHIDLPG